MAEYHVYNGSQLAGYLHNAAGAAPGDTIWCHAGVYVSPETASGFLPAGRWDPILAGTLAQPITVRAMPYERVQIVGPRWKCQGADVRYWGLELTYLGAETRISTQTGSDPTDQPARMVINITGDRVKHINCIIHATNGGVGFYSSGLAIDAELYGCLIFNNGWQGADRGNGNHAYIQSSTGIKYITDCLGWNSFGPGFKGYGRAAAVNGIRFVGCMSWNAGAYAVDTPGQGAMVQNYLVTAEDNPPTGIVAQDCIGYHRPLVGVSNLSFAANSAAQGGTVSVTGNWLAGGVPLSVHRYDTVTVTGNRMHSPDLNDPTVNDGLAGFSQDSGGLPAVPYTWNTNEYWDLSRVHSNGFRQPFSAGGLYRRWSGVGSFGGLGWREYTNYDAASTYVDGRPTGTWIRVRPNAYEPGRAHIGVLNWGLTSTVSVDISSAGLTLGQTFEVMDVQNLFGPPVLTGTYSGAPITLPMSLTVVARVLGMTWEPAHTASEFAVFLLRPAVAGAPPAPPPPTTPTYVWPGGLGVGVECAYPAGAGDEASIAGKTALSPTSGRPERGIERREN